MYICDERITLFLEQNMESSTWFQSGARGPLGAAHEKKKV